MDRSTLKAVVLVPVICLSLIPFFFWCIYFIGAILNIEILFLLQGFNDSVLKDRPLFAAFLSAQPFVTFIGGAIGWVSLIWLSKLWRASWSQVPLWVKVGNIIGIVSALGSGALIFLTVWPVIWSSSLLISAFVKKPHPAFQQTASGGRSLGGAP